MQDALPRYFSTEKNCRFLQYGQGKQCKGKQKHSHPLQSTKVNHWNVITKKNIIFLTVAMVDHAFMVDRWEIKAVMANTFLDHDYFIECTKSLF